ncbi:hypothetical protein BofuT4_P137110.1 [Botrytis cinerea T4]|uniref:Uncharacterized protein n=1 Tax=Botryotinia fuckeliana (strain T4) TaxID=999810 RepID=G2YPW8_BOTF4|nr:hypothetical protein BofuT4_P137110.1 [Botrytis cinerea T4]
MSLLLNMSLKLTFVNEIALLQIWLDQMCIWARACPAKSLKLQPHLVVNELDGAPSDLADKIP